jgi:hypothetical protein
LASTACYRDSFIFTVLLVKKEEIKLHSYFVNIRGGNRQGIDEQTGDIGVLWQTPDWTQNI